MSEATEATHETQDIEIVEDLSNKQEQQEHKQKDEHINVDPIVVPQKRINELTDKERDILITNARNGIDNPYYNVKIYKNGSTRICKKKKPTVSNQAVTSNGERTVLNKSGEQKVYLTNDQLLWEHIFELENKYSNLYRKHKKMKARYNDLYIEDDIQPLTPRPNIQEEHDQQQQQQTLETIQEDEQQAEHQQTQQSLQQQQQQYIPIRGWRASLMQKRNFVV